MELELFRHDLVQTSSSNRGTLVVLPMGEEKKPQKVAAGDLTGVTQCFSVKKGEIQMAFKTLPSSSKVTSISLGKAWGQRDRIFVAAGSQIRGISRKGKDFFKFNTQLTESITKVDVFDKTIWTSAEYVHNQYLEGKDKAFYLSPDRINAAEIFPLISAQEWSPALACQDRHIRVLQGNEVLLDVPTVAAPVALLYSPESHDPRHRFPNSKELLCSTDTGLLVQMLCDVDGCHQGFTLPNPKKLGAIKAIFTGIDFTKTGSSDMVVGREDGLVEIYDLDETGAPQQVFSAKLTESINALDGGYVTTLNTQEIVLQTFTGKVLTYSPPGGGIVIPQLDRRGRQIINNEEVERKAGYQAQISRLKQDLYELGVQLDAEKAKFSKGSESNALLAASAPFTVQDTCKLEADEACYVLTVESAMPIFTVAMQCTIPLQLLDVPSNVAILSRSPPDEANGNMTLATYRCQDATTRISIKFNVREGQSGELQAFIIPNVTPKTCVSVSHKIRPLCLHTRIPAADVSRPTNELVVTGTFDVADMHAWITTLLDDVPPLAPGAESGTLYFQNALLGTQLTCRYRVGEARFMSDLISTLGMLRDHLMAAATNAKHRLNVTCSPSSASLSHSVALVWPQLEQQRTLKKKFSLLEGLLELKMQDGDVSYLAPEYQEILDKGDSIKAAYKEQPQHLDHLIALIKQLYIDFCMLTGIAAPKQRLPALEQLLTNTRSTQEDVLDFMLGKQPGGA